MSTGIQISSGSSGITVGTTAVTSGTNGRVFFQAGGVVQQDANFTFDNTLKRLTLKAVNTGAGDIPFAVQNSASTGVLFQATGDGKHSFNMSPNTNFALSIDQTSQNGGIAVYSSGQTIFNVAKIAGSVGYMGVLNNGNYSFFTGNSSYFNHSLVVGGNSLSPGARLDVRAADGLSNLAFRVRNSVDTLDILQVRGDTRIIQNINVNTATTYAGFNVAGENTDTYVNAVVSGNQPMAVGFRARSGNAGNSIQMFSDNGNVSGVGSASTHIWHSSTGYMYFGNMGGNAIGFKFGASNGSTLSNSSGMLGMLIKSNVSSNQSIFTLGTYLGTTTSNPSSNYGGNTFFIANGTAPTLTEVDSFGLYSADITAGNAAPHFRTENGSIIKLYRETTAVGAATLVSGSGTTLTDTDTFDGYTLEQVVKALRNLGILA